MIIFLYGADSYRSKQKLDDIIAYYKTRNSGLNLISLDVSKADFADFYTIFTTSSMFTEKKLVIVKNIFANKEFQERFLESVKNLQALSEVIVVYENQEVDQRLKLFKTLIKECKSQCFDLLSSASLRQFFTKEFENNKAKCNGDALQLLVNYVGNDLWRASHEIKKLVHFKQGGTIKKEDVELLVRPTLETDIFKTIDALAIKDKRGALELLQKHVVNGDDPLYLLSMVGWGFKNLLVVKELAEQGLMYDSIVKKSGLHPFVVKKNYFASRHFSLSELKAMYGALFQIDADIKRGLVEPDTALNLFVSRI